MKPIHQFSAVTLHASMRGRIFQSESVESHPSGWCLLGAFGHLRAQELTTTQHGIVLKKVVTQQAVGIRGVLVTCSWWNENPQFGCAHDLINQS